MEGFSSRGDEAASSCVGARPSGVGCDDGTDAFESDACRARTSAPPGQRLSPLWDVPIHACLRMYLLEYLYACGFTARWSTRGRQVASGAHADGETEARSAGHAESCKVWTGTAGLDGPGSPPNVWTVLPDRDRRCTVGSIPSARHQGRLVLGPIGSRARVTWRWAGPAPLSVPRGARFDFP